MTLRHTSRDVASGIASDDEARAVPRHRPIVVLATPQMASAQIDQLVQWTTESGGNGHWYRYRSTISIFESFSFATAQAAAEARSHNGFDGYLATVTSQAEQDFINGSFSYLIGFGGSSSAWLGASDTAVEGEWRWRGGPEAGQLVRAGFRRISAAVRSVTSPSTATDRSPPCPNRPVMHCWRRAWRRVVGW